MNARQNPRAGEFYRHFKNKYYQIIGIAEHTETKEALVVYQALYGEFRIFARPLSIFMSEVDRKRYSELEFPQKYRFERIEQMGKRQEEREFEEKQIQETEKLQKKKTKEENKKEENNVNDRLLKFLDADSYKEKLNILQGMKKELDDKMINDIAVVLDIVIEEGNLETRIEALENCLKTFIKFECSRLR